MVTNLVPDALDNHRRVQHTSNSEKPDQDPSNILYHPNSLARRISWQDVTSRHIVSA